MAYQQLLDSNVEKAERTFWPPNEFESDPTCGEHAILTVPPVAAITLSNIVCFPGSGSKWILEMIQFLAGYITDVK